MDEPETLRTSHTKSWTEVGTEQSSSLRLFLLLLLLVFFCLFVLLRCKPYQRARFEGKVWTERGNEKRFSQPRLQGLSSFDPGSEVKILSHQTYRS